MPDKITVGGVEIISLLDTPMQFPFPVFFPNRPESDFQPYKDLYPRSSGNGMFKTQAGAYALRSQGKAILCDTGIGPGPIAVLGGIEGKLLDDMRAKGVSPSDIDIVIHTHLHGDHVGHNLDGGGNLNFPKAKYYVPQADWEFFSGAIASSPQMAQVTPLKDLGALELFSGEKSLTSEVTTLPTPGHTPGHTSLLVSSNGEKALITGDLAHHPAQVDQPDWCSGFDMDHPTTAETRRKIFDQMEVDGAIGAFCHFPDAFGKLARLDGKRVFQAL